MQTTLRSKTKTAILWRVSENVGIQGIQFFVSIILARLLMPEQFGVIGMLMIFIGIAQTFSSGGFVSALIHFLIIKNNIRIWFQTTFLRTFKRFF